MRYCQRSVLILMVSAGCTGRDSDSDPDPGTSGDDGCETDESCGFDEICESGACVQGDRDNQFDEATPIFQESPADGVINPAEDIDYYAYTSVGDEWLRIETTPDEDESGSDTLVAVYDAGGGLHAWIDDFPTGDVSDYDSVLHVYLPTAGTWYISVEHHGSFAPDDEIEPDGGDEFFYTLELEPYSSVTDETDSADDPSVVVDVETTSTIYAIGVELETAGDSDWMTVDLPVDLGPLELWGNAGNVGSEADVTVRAWNPGGELLLDKASLGVEGPAFYYQTSEGDHLVEVTDAAGGGSERHWTVVYVRSRDPDYYGLTFDAEPNDSADAVQFVPTETFTTESGTDYLAAFVTGVLDPAGDEDWFSIVADPDSYITALCSSDSLGSQLDPALDVYGPDGALLGSGTDGQDSAPDVYNLGPVDSGTVTFRVFAEGGVAEGPSAYYRCYFYATPFEVSS